MLLVVSAAPALLAQDASIKPNDALILHNIPAVPASIAERAARYTDFRTATMYGWHPQKREILIGTRFADTVQVHQVAIPGGARTQRTFSPAASPTPVTTRTTATTFCFTKTSAEGSGTRYSALMWRQATSPC
jgi:hypothetical protein